jgi:methyl-accepting chemotaxis protein
MEDGKTKVAEGVAAAERCSHAFDCIVDNVSKVNEMISAISIANREQASGVHEITKAMSQLNEATQQSAASSEQAAGSAEGLSTESEVLQQVVDSLSETIFANGAA